MKIYIVGSVASGKTTYAKKLSNKFDIACVHLDGVVHKRDKSDKKWGNVKRTDEEINQIFLETLRNPQWIIEDAGRKCFAKGMDEADIIVHLKPSLLIRKKRVITRFIKQKLGLEACTYTPNLRMLKSMFIWLKNYESGRDNLESRLKEYSSKTSTLKNNAEIRNFTLSLRTM